MPVLPAAIAAKLVGTGVDILKAAPGALGLAIGSLGPAAIAHRKALYADRDQMDAGALGFSEAQKNQMMGNVNSQIQAANQNAYNQFRQLGNAGTNSGAGQAALQANSNASANAAASALAGIENASQAQVQARRNDILGRLAEQKEIAKRDWSKAMGGADLSVIKKPTFGLTPDKAAVNTIMNVPTTSTLKPTAVQFKPGAQPYLGATAP